METLEEFKGCSHIAIPGILDQPGGHRRLLRTCCATTWDFVCEQVWEVPGWVLLGVGKLRDLPLAKAARFYALRMKDTRRPSAGLQIILLVILFNLTFIGCSAPAQMKKDRWKRTPTLQRHSGVAVYRAFNHINFVKEELSVKVADQKQRGMD